MPRLLSHAAPPGPAEPLPHRLRVGLRRQRPLPASLALLADFTQDDAYACARYQGLKWDVVCELPAQGWEITGDALQDWVERHPMESTPGHPLE